MFNFNAIARVGKLMAPLGIAMVLAGTVSGAVSGAQATAGSPMPIHQERPIQIQAKPGSPALKKSPMPTPSAQAESPSSALLDEYARRLFPEPECATSGGCSQMQSVSVGAGAAGLDLTMEIHAMARSVAELPSIGGAQWAWKPGSGARLAKLQDGAIGVLVEAGVSKITLGMAPFGSEVVLSFQKAPKFVLKPQLAGWRLDAPEQGAATTLRLSKEKTGLETKEDAKGAAASAAKFDAPLFMDMRRDLRFDATGADISTTFTRLTPADKPASTTHELFADEKLLTEGLASEDGKSVKINFAAGETSVSVASRWNYKGPLSLAANASGERRETWIVEPWNKAPMKFAGLDPVALGDNRSGLVFMPKPGEKVSMTAQAIVPAQGAQIAVDSSRMEQSMGESRAQYMWSLRARSTIAAPIELSAPGPWKLEKATNNGQAAAPTRKGDKYVVDLMPGDNALELHFAQERSSAWLEKSPSVGVSAPVANLTWSMSVPDTQWVLLVWGPLLGPAVLIWGVLAAIMALAWFLAKKIQSDFAPSFWGWVALLVPLSALSPWSSVWVMLFVVGLGLKAKKHARIKESHWNRVQLALILMGVASASILLSGVYAGLLGMPDMMVEGNGSNAGALHWYQDKAPVDGSVSAGLEAGAILAPIWLWRVIMLGWALWMAATISKRIPTMWAALVLGGIWRRKEKNAPAKLGAEPSGVSPRDSSAADVFKAPAPSARDMAAHEEAEYGEDGAKDDAPDAEKR